MRRKQVWIIGGGVLVAAAIALAVILLFLPGGASSPSAAILERIGDNGAGEAKVLVDREWGEGRFVLASYGGSGEHRLALAFAIEQGGGWRLAAYTEETVSAKDVVVASLLVASSEGGAGQPPWSAAAGEISDDRIVRVEVHWASGSVTSAPRTKGGYLVLDEGTTTPLEARYLAKDGTEIAKVPIEGSS